MSDRQTAREFLANRKLDALDVDLVPNYHARALGAMQEKFDREYYCRPGRVIPVNGAPMDIIKPVEVYESNFGTIIVSEMVDPNGPNAHIPVSSGTCQFGGYVTGVDPAKEDLLDSITNISPIETPFMSQIREASKKIMDGIERRLFDPNWVADRLTPVDPFEGWFRRPKFVECTRRGDTRRYFWIMEQVLGRRFGAAFDMPETILAVDPGSLEREKVRAFGRMMLRSQHDEFLLPEGANWEEFEREPLLWRRDGKGRYWLEPRS